MKKRQSFLILSILFTLTISITACTPSSDTALNQIESIEIQSTEAPQTNQQATQVPQPTTPIPQLQTSYSIYFPQELITNNIQSGLIDGQIAEIIETSPDIDITYRIKENSVDTTIFEFLEKAYLAAPDALPDLIILPHDMMQIAAQNEYIMPINQDNITLFTDENAFPFVKQMAQVDGVYYGVPLIADVMTMVVTDDQQELNTWVDVLSSNKVLRIPLSDESSLFTFLLYQSLQGEINTSQGYIELETSKLSQVFGFLYEASQKGIIPQWLNEYENYNQLWRDSIDSNDNIITWYSNYANGYLDSYSADFIPSETGEDLTYADGYVICLTNKGEENYATKLEIINRFTDSLFIANYSLSLNKIPMSSSSLGYWGETKNAAVVSYLAPSARVKPSLSILNEAGFVINTYLNQILTNEIDIPEALNQINQELQP